MHKFEIPDLIIMARHSPDEETLAITIQTDKHTALRFKRWLHMVQMSGNIGHSGLFAMSLDGDGSEYFNVDGIDFKSLPPIKEKYTSSGRDVEIALEDGYTSRNFQR